MKLVGAFLLAVVMGGTVNTTDPSQRGQTLLRITSTSSESASFIVDGSGGSHLIDARATHVRVQDGRRVVEIVTPATIAIPPDAEFVLRLQAMAGTAPLRLRIEGSPTEGVERLQLEGEEIELARRDKGGNVEVVRTGAIWMR
jgi:hypothetical protein